LTWKRLFRTSLGAVFTIFAVAAPAATAAAPWKPIPNYRGAVPVLCYHGVHAGAPSSLDPYSVSREELARQLEMLSDAGFNTISIAQYARFAAGDTAGLPNRPILITFDDGRTDSHDGADTLLARHGMRATMFVITANATLAKPGYLGWPKLASMAASGRWEIQEHANAGHVLIPTGPRNRTGPYYANLLYRRGKRETFTTFKRRVTADILLGRRLLGSRIPDFVPIAFAPPYGDYGQHRTNYAPITAWEREWLKRTFEVFFVQDRRVYNLPGNPIGQRYGVRSSTTAEALYQWLARALPKSALVPSGAKRPRRPSLRRLRVGRRSVLMVFKRRRGIALRVTRRRAGRRHSVRVRISAGVRVRDRRLRPATVYVYRAVAIDVDGDRSRLLRLRVRTRRH
jgi:peptidoglycan/xylan/chitin deacetylase (PgdA/CDA1 family)